MHGLSPKSPITAAVDVRTSIDQIGFFAADSRNHNFGVSDLANRRNTPALTMSARTRTANRGHSGGDGDKRRNPGRRYGDTQLDQNTEVERLAVLCWIPQGAR